MGIDESKQADCSHDEQQEGLQVPLDEHQRLKQIFEMIYIKITKTLENTLEQHMNLTKGIVDAQQKLMLAFDELKADFGILRDRVAMLDGCFTDDEDDFWRDLYKKGYQNDDYEAFVAVRGPHLAKMDIIERAGMMKQFEKVVEDLTSRD